jgi:NodT family efflux transporter outer membrane factor (OMF) lipoprotein
MADAGSTPPADFNVKHTPDTPTPLAAVVGGVGIAKPTNEPTTTESSALLGVDEFYKDPILTGLIQQGIAGNRELKILDQEIQIASFEVLGRRGAYLPVVTVGGMGGMEKPSLYTSNGAVEDQLSILPGQAFPNPLWNTNLGLNVFWQLDIWRKFRNARDAAIQRYIAASEKRNYFVTKLVAEIAENYYNLLALDKRMENLDVTIQLQENSLAVAKAFKDAGRLTELPVQRFQAEVRKNQSEKLIVTQDIIETENRINFLANRYPQPVERASANFFDLSIHTLSLGVPSQLLLNRPDIRQAEREIAAAGLEVKVARADFLPSLTITAGVGFEAFNPAYLFRPDALAANAAGNLAAPLVNRAAIKAVYGSANARQLEAIYNYQRVILNAFTEVVNRVSMAENYRKSLEIKKQQLDALEASVNTASFLFQNVRAEYIEVLLAQRDLRDARIVFIETKKQQLTSIVNAYQALGGGGNSLPIPIPPPPPQR